MLPQDIYEEFLIKLNKADSNTNISIPKGKFVLMFNGQIPIWQAARLDKNESSNKIDDLEYLLESDVEIAPISSFKIKSDYLLPSNFFRRVSATVVSNTECCKNIPLYVWFVKPKDVNVLLQNDNQKPSFDYQETIATINNGKISIYKDSFELNELNFSYYRKPILIDIAGYRKSDGTFSQDIQTDLDDRSVDEVLNRTVIEATINTESSEQAQLAIKKVQLNEN